MEDELLIFIIFVLMLEIFFTQYGIHYDLVNILQELKNK